MPEKNIREMTELEKKHFSLAAKTFHATLMGAIVFGVVSLLIGLGLYAYALAQQYIGTAFNLSRNAAAIIEKIADPEPFVEQVMTTYRALPETERKNADTDAYRAHFAAYTTDAVFESIRGILKDFYESSDVYDVYLGMYDRETSALVYLVDPADGEADYCLPGDWDSVTRRGMKKYLTWDGKGKLYDIDNTERYGWMCTAGMPIQNADGEIICFVLTDVTLENVGHGMSRFFWQYTGGMIVIVFLVAYFMTHHTKRTVIAPINAISDAAIAYVQDKQDGVLDSKHFRDLNISTGDEIENLYWIMSDMERDLSTYEENLTRAIAEKERIGTELELATRIQADMLPNIYPAFPDRPEFDIYATMTPAKEVGGDFYDFFLIDQNHLGIVMADVSGKGVPAALFMMASKILLQNHAMMGKSPKEVLECVNNQICSNNREQMFVTVWLGVLDITTGVITAANAGHEYPVWKKDANGVFELLKDKHGFVVGGMAGVSYREYEIAMQPGTKLFLYTDGVPEANNANNELFGNARMLAALNEAADGSVTEVLASVNRAVEAFAAGAPQFDDLTMLCLEYIGKGDRI